MVRPTFDVAVPAREVKVAVAVVEGVVVVPVESNDSVPETDMFIVM